MLAMQALIAYSTKRAVECGKAGGQAIDCWYKLGGHVLGGAYSERPNNATSYAHRDKLFVVDATIGLPTWAMGISPEIPGMANKMLDDFME